MVMMLSVNVMAEEIVHCTDGDSMAFAILPSTDGVTIDVARMGSTDVLRYTAIGFNKMDNNSLQLVHTNERNLLRQMSIDVSGGTIRTVAFDGDYLISAHTYKVTCRKKEI